MRGVQAQLQVRVPCGGGRRRRPALTARCHFPPLQTNHASPPKLQPGSVPAPRLRVQAARGGFRSSKRRGGSQPWRVPRPPRPGLLPVRRGFGTASLPLHVPRCLELWERRAAAAAGAPGARPPPPQPPELSEPLPRTAEAVAAFNERMTSVYEAACLVGCPHCGRTFLPSAFEHHARHCMAGAPMARGSAGGGARREGGCASGGGGPGGIQGRGRGRGGGACR